MKGNLDNETEISKLVDLEAKTWETEDDLNLGGLYVMPALAQHVTGVVEFSHNSLIQSIMEYVSMPGQINFIRGPAGIGKTLALAIAASCVQKQKRFLVYFEDARSPYHLYSDGKDRPTLYKQEFLYRVAKWNAHVWDEYIGSDIDRRQLQKKKDGYNVNEIYAAVFEKLIAAQLTGNGL